MEALGNAAHMGSVPDCIRLGFLAQPRRTCLAPSSSLQCRSVALSASPLSRSKPQNPCSVASVGISPAVITAEEEERGREHPPADSPALPTDTPAADPVSLSPSTPSPAPQTPPAPRAKSAAKPKLKGSPPKKLAPSTKQRRDKDWMRAKELLHSAKVWRSKVEALNAGGAMLRFGSLLAFLPFSQLEPRRQQGGENNWEGLVGSYVTVQFIEADQEKGRLLVSERKAQKKLRMEELVPGQVCEGLVSAVADYGAFVDLLGKDGEALGVGGLVHASELSWDAVLSPAAVVSIGQRVRVKVLRIEKGKGRMALSTKQVQSDPLFQTLDALLPSSDPQEGGTPGVSGMLVSQQPLAEELLGASLPGLQDLCDALRQQQGVVEVSLGRQALERRVVSQDLELWLSNVPVKDGQFTLVARAGRQVQEVFVKSTLEREGMKAAVLTVTSSIP